MTGLGLVQTWLAHWDRDPHKVVIREVAAGEVGTLSVTAGEVVVESTRVARALHGLGVREGDRVILSADPGIDTVLAYVALLRSGAIVVPANTAYTTRELEHIVDDVQPTAIVASEPGRFRGVGSGVACATPMALRAEMDADDSSARESRIALDRCDPNAPAMIAYTSGTTGRPKGAVLRHRHLAAGAAAVVRAWAWSRDDSLIHALPMFHMHGLGVGINGTFFAGASMVVLRRFSAELVRAVVQDESPTMFFGVPTMYSMLDRAEALPVLAPLRILVSGSAPLDPVLFGRIEAATGQRPVERYGMSETVMLCSNPYDESVHRRHPGQVGRALPGVGVRIASTDEPGATDHVGEVEVSGPNVFDSYWRAPEATRAAFSSDGWFRTGDLGMLDEDGVLTLVGRSSELIITGGYNVYPREVEDVLHSHAGISDVAVVGVRDDTWGERVVAAVVPAATPADVEPPTAALADGLAALADRELAPYKRPREYVVVSGIPRNPLGKILRAEVRGLIASDPSARGDS